MSNQPTLLIVDDESGILDTLRILLKKEGFEVTTAQAGRRGSRRSARASSISC